MRVVAELVLLRTVQPLVYVLELRRELDQVFKLDAELELKGELDDRKGESARVAPVSARGLEASRAASTF